MADYICNNATGFQHLEPEPGATLGICQSRRGFVALCDCAVPVWILCGLFKYWSRDAQHKKTTKRYVKGGVELRLINHCALPTALCGNANMSATRGDALYKRASV